MRIEVIDKLQRMWDQQVDFVKLLTKHRAFPECPVDITSKSGQQTIDAISHHMMKELFEAGQHLKNSKSHRLTEITDFNRAAFIEELVDVLHLFFEICIASGISMNELFLAYIDKGLVNTKRILNNY